jgi:TPP-dependent pyruvate/acetoin dehydrogenase alpha subunit
VEQLRKNDPIVRLGRQLRERKLLDEVKDNALRARVHRQVEQAYDFARASSYRRGFLRALGASAVRKNLTHVDQIQRNKNLGRSPVVAPAEKLKAL